MRGQTFGRMLPFLLLLLLATFLRFYQLDHQSFWNDEGNSARLSERSVAKIIEGTASDVHPPLYYLALRGWRELVGESEFGLRALSAFAGVLTVAVVVGWGQRPLSRPIVAVWLAGLLTAVSPALIYYSQEARMYSLLALWATLSSWLLFRWLAQWTHHPPLPDGRYFLLILSYMVSSAAGLYTHYSFPAVLVAHNLILLLWLGERYRAGQTIKTPLRHWILTMLVTIASYLPWWPIFWRQTGGGGTADPLIPYLQAAGGWLLFGPTAEVISRWVWLATAVWLMGRLLHRRGWRSLLDEVLLLFVPVLFLYGVGATQPQYFKFLTVAIPPLALLLAGTITAERFAGLGGKVKLALGVIFLGATAVALQNLYHNPAYARADYRAIANRIISDAPANAGIILNAPNQWEVFTYYYKEASPVYPLPRSLSQPTADSIAAELQAITAQHARLYVVFWGEEQRDPERLVERWLDAHAYKATEEWVGDVRFVTYAVPDEPATEMATAVALPFGSAITLEGYTLNSTQFVAGDILQVALFWQTAVALDQRYKIFLHLLDENGTLVTQRDAEPGGNLIPTTIWSVNETITDNHGLLIPSHTPPGNYSLVLGLYDLTNPQERLPTPTGDSYLLSQITILGE